MRRGGEERRGCQRELTGGRRQALGPQTSLDGRNFGGGCSEGWRLLPGDLTHYQPDGVLKQHPELKVSGEDESEPPIMG